MTIEEHIENLKAIASDMPSDKCSDWIESLMAGVKSLEQEPCGDCISRQAAIKAAMQDVDDRRTHGFNAGATRAANRIKLLPPITPLQEHGRLCDLDELVKNIVKEYGVNSIHELPQDIKMFYDKFINSAPTILDATFDYKLNNYSFFRKEERG